mmetsp:Transcript_27551/g.36126  ORF Transcript_27551/g.36126 Transcript_27551/m.36126 type:complete len:716 (+) Transcript_27551:108-2255(+)
MASGDKSKDFFEAAVNAAMKEDKTKDFQMTEEEAKKFREAFEEPEFRKLFADYVDEISDPKYREETEMYINQLEGEKKVPEGKELVRPDPGFVLKTHLNHKKPQAESRQKIFINVVQSDVVAKPSSKPATGNQKAGGANWSLPYCVGQIRMDRDKKDQTVPTVDVCLHPDSISRAKSSAAFKNLLAQVAIEGVERQYDALGQPNTTLEKKYHVLKGVAYKSGKPGVMLVASKKKEMWDSDKAQGQKDQKGKASGAPASKSTAPAAEKQESSPASPKPSLANKSQGKPKPVTQKIINETTKGPPIPQNTLIERGNFELSAHMDNERIIPANYPKELVIKIQLPLLARASEADLDVSTTNLNLTTANGKYSPLKINLPRPVFEEQGAAKFDKKAKVLTVTLPVRPPPPSKRPPVLPQDEAQPEVSSTEPEEEEKEEQSKLPPPPANKKPSKADHDRWISDPPPSQKFELTPPLVPAPATQPPTSSEKEKPKSAVDLKLSGDFVPADKFLGGQPGYVFKTDSQGLGYYLDKTTTFEPVDPLEPTRKSPIFEFRQNARTITILIQTPGIQASTVVPQWKPKQIIIDFTAVEDGSEESKFSLKLELCGEIDPSKCRFDVATRNMIVILYKTQEGIWPSLEVTEKSEQIKQRNDEEKSSDAIIENKENKQAQKKETPLNHAQAKKNGEPSPIDNPRPLSNNIADVGAQNMRLKNSLIYELD